jgi:hypothetical protein
MLMSVMSVLEERLPCSDFVFRELELFKSRMQSDEVLVNSTPEKEFEGEVKAFAQPRIMKCFVP